MDSKPTITPWGKKSNILPLNTYWLFPSRGYYNQHNLLEQAQILQGHKCGLHFRYDAYVQTAYNENTQRCKT